MYRRDTGGGKGNETAGVVGQTGRAGMVVDWGGWRGRDVVTGGRKYPQNDLY